MARTFGRIRTGLWQTGTPLTARQALTLLFLGSGVRCLFVAPDHLASATLSLRLLGGACIAVAALLVAVDLHVRGPLSHVLVIALVAVTTVIVSVAPDRGDAILRAFGFPWSALYAALYMSRRAAHTYAIVASAAFAVGIGIADIPDMFGAWVLVTVTVIAVTTATSGLVTAMRLQTEADPLTGIANRAGFVRLAKQALTTADRQRQTVAVIMCDIDGLKGINDRQGHAAGDALLRDVATGWQPSLRAGDLFARLGGDEFAVLLPNTDARGAEETVSRLRDATSAAFSAGIAVRAPGEPLEEVLGRADAAMYANKGARRTRAAMPVQRAPRRTAIATRATPIR